MSYFSIRTLQGLPMSSLCSLSILSIVTPFLSSLTCDQNRSSHTVFRQVWIVRSKLIKFLCVKTCLIKIKQVLSSLSMLFVSLQHLLDKVSAQSLSKLDVSLATNIGWCSQIPSHVGQAWAEVDDLKISGSEIFRK